MGIVKKYYYQYTVEIWNVTAFLFFFFLAMYNASLNIDMYEIDYIFSRNLSIYLVTDPWFFINNPLYTLFIYKNVILHFWGNMYTFHSFSLDDYQIYINEFLEKGRNNLAWYEISHIRKGISYFVSDTFWAAFWFSLDTIGSVIIEYKNTVFDGLWFVKFGFLFIATTIFSLLGLSYLGLYGVFIINLIPLFLFWVSSLFFLKKIFFSKIFFFILLGKWFSFNVSQKINFELYIDYISMSFIVLTLSIALFVYTYCFSYFRYEPNVERLLLFINLFVISMILLVSSGNFVVLFLGWELIGLTSFFLINFWSTRMGTLKAAFKAFLFNKFSDVSILMSCILCYLLINDFNIMVFNNQIHFYVNYYISILGFEVSYIELMSFFLLTAAFIKSAQFGTHIWLPDSMEAPVPASALIHSATLVSAGVFLLLRFSPLFELSTYTYYVLPIVGSFTAFFGGICAAYQSDIKRILAYSTISHCGFLMVSFTTNICEYTILYLYIHGFFKAAVFLCVGNVIRFSRNYQDFRRMGGFSKYLPLECYMSFICLVNLSGLPFSLGFYIKHVLLIGLPEYINYFIFLNVVGGALCGIIYSYRLFYYVFFDFKKAKKAIYYASTRKLLQSIFYSNTTLASNLSICLLMLVSYIISLYFINICINNLINNSELVHFYWTNANIYEYNLTTKSLLNNISYINWSILFIIFLCYLVKWRVSLNYSFFLTKFYLLLNSVVFTSIIYSIIS